MNRTRVSVVLALCLTLGALAFSAPVLAADDPDGFVRNRINARLSMSDLLNDRFGPGVLCQEDCLITAARLVLPSADAAELGFQNVRRGRYFEIGRVENVRLKARDWTKVAIPLTAGAKKRLRGAEDGVRVHGQLLAESTESGRYGNASWIRTCRWPSD